MKRAPWMVLLAVLAVPAFAQPAPETGAQRVEVQLSSFKFAPQRIHLRAGQPVTLHLVNTASGGHNFSAPEFFANAQVRAEDAGLVAKGTVEVPRRASRDVSLVPRAGKYPLKCTHAFHTTFGMKGKIIVD